MRLETSARSLSNSTRECADGPRHIVLLLPPLNGAHLSTAQMDGRRRGSDSAPVDGREVFVPPDEQDCQSVYHALARSVPSFFWAQPPIRRRLAHTARTALPMKLRPNCLLDRIRLPAADHINGLPGLLATISAGDGIPRPSTSNAVEPEPVRVTKCSGRGEESPPGAIPPCSPSLLG